MAEGILRHLSKGQVDVFSAGSEPEAIHPLAIRVLSESGIDIRQQRSKHLEEFRGQKFDYIITVCDRVREACPVFPGDPEQIHWSFPDPAEVEGEPTRQRAFRDTATQLLTRINYLRLRIEREGKSRR
jgi:protein-tyrosine-phosphatase